MKYFLILTLVFFTSCSTFKYQNTTKKSMPELATIGETSNYLFQKDYNSKTVSTLKDPIRLSSKQIHISKRKLFNKKDSLLPKTKDSIHLSLEILDKFSLIRQLNSDDELIGYLSKTSNYSIVTEVKIIFPDSVLNSIRKADELYLIQNKEKTLSIELRRDNKKVKQIEFSDGEILSYKAQDFCWGQNKKRNIEIVGLVNADSNCKKPSYKSVKKVKKKNEFKF